MSRLSRNIDKYEDAVNDTRSDESAKVESADKNSKSDRTDTQKRLEERKKAVKAQKKANAKAKDSVKSKDSCDDKVGEKADKSDKADRKSKKTAKSEKVGKAGISKVKVVLWLILVGLIVFAGFKIYGFFTTFTPIRMNDDGYSHGKKYEKFTVVNGIDVSEHQGTEIQWKRVKYSGADFVFIRAGYRSVDTGKLKKDANFTANIEGAKKAGLMVGAYYYSQAINAEEAEEEAAALIELVKDYEIDLPLVIDYELYPGGRLAKEISKGNMTTASAYHNIALAFCKKVEAAGYDSGIYGNYDMFTHYMDATYIEKESNLWLAEYGQQASSKAGYRYWQCADDARVGGIKGNVDHNFMYLNPKGVTKVWYAGEVHRTSLKGTKVTFRKDSYKARMSGVKPKVEVIGPEGKRLFEGRDYTVGYANNAHKGTGTVIIRGIGAYRDIITAGFVIE